MPRDEIAEEARLWLGRPRERVLKIKLAREVAGYAGIDLATGRIRADIEYYRSRAVLAERCSPYVPQRGGHGLIPKPHTTHNNSSPSPPCFPHSAFSYWGGYPCTVISRGTGAKATQKRAR